MLKVLLPVYTVTGSPGGTIKWRPGFHLVLSRDGHDIGGGVAQMHPRSTPDAPKMKKGHGSKFGWKREAAIAALLSEKNHAGAACVAGIDLSTFKRWLRMPEFVEEWRRARWEGMEQAYARAQQNSAACISVLLKLMVDPATPASGRIRAALGAFGIATLGRASVRPSPQGDMRRDGSNRSYLPALARQNHNLFSI